MEAQNQRLKQLLAAAKKKLELKNAEIEKKDRIIKEMSHQNMEDQLISQYQSRIWRLQSEIQTHQDKQKNQAAHLVKLEESIKQKDQQLLDMMDHFEAFVKGHCNYEDTLLKLGKIIVPPKQRALLRSREVFQLIASQFQQLGDKYKASSKENTKARMQLMRVMQQKKEDMAKWQALRKQIEDSCKMKIREVQKSSEFMKVGLQRQLLEKESRLKEMSSYETTRMQLQYAKNIIKQYFQGDQSVRKVSFSALIKVFEYSPEQVKTFKM